MNQCNICLYLFLIVIEGASTIGPLFTETKLIALRPRGFRLLLKVENLMDHLNNYSIIYVRFHVNVNKNLENPADADFIATIREPVLGEWVYDNTNVRINHFTRIAYSVSINASYNGGTTFETFSSEINDSLHNRIVRAPARQKSFDADKRDLDKCEKSVTTVGRKPVCKGELIFEDNFDTLDSNIWKKEIRIPTDSKDSSFVSFQNASTNCYAFNGQLHIIPTLLSDSRHYDESDIRTGQMHLPDCTPIEDELRECTMKAQYSQILPPIVSAKIRTKDSFSFRYGRVVIRAKVPKGDWIVPLIVLDPLENYYGFTEYASGQIRIVHTFGNEILVDILGRSISNVKISGGPVLESRQPVRDSFLSYALRDELLGNDYHNYSLTWTEKGFTLGIDDTVYGQTENRLTFVDLKYSRRWKNGHQIAPFDREFFLTLGVSVGGHADFPDGCLNGPGQAKKPWKNGDPKAMLNFWKDRTNWRSTWKGYDAGLHIDFIKVYAL